MRKKQEKRFCIFGHHKYKKSILKLSARNHKDSHLIKSIWQKAF